MQDFIIYWFSVMTAFVAINYVCHRFQQYDRMWENNKAECIRNHREMNNG